LFRIYLQQPHIAITHLGYFDIKEDNILSKAATFVNKFLHTDVVYKKSPGVTRAIFVDGAPGTVAGVTFSIT
jgi:hypothetical protein